MKLFFFWILTPVSVCKISILKKSQIDYKTIKSLYISFLNLNKKAKTSPLLLAFYKVNI